MKSGDEVRLGLRSRLGGPSEVEVEVVVEGQGEDEAGSRLGVPLSLRVKDDHAAHPADHAVVAGLLHFFEVDSCGPPTLPLDVNRSQ